MRAKAAFGLRVVLCGVAAFVALAAHAADAPVPLREGWAVQSGCKVQAAGEAISTTAFHAQEWIAATVPATVLATQVASGAVPDPYFGLNLRSLPGTDYPVGENYSNLPMPKDSPYACPWWYRKAFAIPAADKGRTLWLRFGGINYRANIWVNGKRITDDSQVAGAYRTYEFDITKYAVTGRENVVAVETFAPTETDLGINWVDWNPCPPDKNMGLWGPVSLATSGPVSVRSPLVTTHFPDASLNEADLTVYAELHNASSRTVEGVVTGTAAGIALRQQVTLGPNEDRTVVFDPQQVALLKLKHPRVWWPVQMGSPTLETATIAFGEGGRLSDEQTIRFGIREVTSELTENGARLFRINGKPLLIRGAGWSQDMLLRQSPEYLENEFRLVRDMHLNTIRLEGKLETEDFFRLADEQGILVMLGWCCCDHWEHWDKWTPANLEIAQASLRSQMLRLRHHASLLVWLNGSDNPPPANVESAYLKIEADTHWPNPVLSSASQAPTTVTGKSGVKMTGPYDYVAPSYWLVEKDRYGGAHGFNTETSPGPAIPTLSSLRRFLPKDKMWPPEETWSLHYGGEGFRKLTVYNDAMAAIYGPPAGLEDYVRVSQTMAYDGERAMFEAYSRNKYASTGVVQWMLNNAWPSMIWHLYDFYLDAGGGYFGAKKACEPLHVQYSYDDQSVVVVNSRYVPAGAVTVSAKVYDFGLKQLYSHEEKLPSVDADSSQRVFAIPAAILNSSQKVSFVRLELRDAAGQVVSRNFYWVPSELTEFDWAKTDYTHTPASRHEDMTLLRTLPKTTVTAEATKAADGSIEVRLHNGGSGLAFQVAVAAQDARGSDITPALWSDNYVELMPGESRSLTVTFPEKRSGVDAVIHVSGWNIAPQTLKPAAEAHVASK